jgi:hypothetical protein
VEQGQKRPPPRAAKTCDELIAAIAAALLKMSPIGSHPVAALLFNTL